MCLQPLNVTLSLNNAVFETFLSVFTCLMRDKQPV